jgi:hypothetical protein
VRFGPPRTLHLMMTWIFQRIPSAFPRARAGPGSRGTGEPVGAGQECHFEEKRGKDFD